MLARYFICLFLFSLLYADSLTKNGPGTLTMTGDSSATIVAAEPITVNAGTLVVNNTLGSATGMLTFGTSTLHITGAAFSSARTVSLTGAATFDIDAGTSTFSAVISNTGSLTKSNTAATLVLANTNTFSGGTTIQGGTLSLTAVSALPMNGDVTLNNTAAVQLNDNNQSIGGLSSSSATTVNTGTMAATVFSIGNGGASSSFSGVISGSGQVTKDGGGTLTLLGANTYSGGTSVAAGTLVGNTTSLQGGTAGRNISTSSGALLIFDQAADGTFGNNVTGMGAVTKQNSGILTISSTSNIAITNPVTSIVTIEGGTLSVEGFVGGHELIVQSGTTLKGNGIIAMTVGINPKVDVFGTCSPGTSIDFLNIFGDYIQEAGSTLEIELNPAGDVDLINATGVVTINGGTLQLIPEFGTYSPFTNYTIIVAGGGVAATPGFVAVTSTLPSFQAEVNYLSNSVVLVVGIVPFSQLFQSGNAGEVARCLDQFSLTQGTDIDTVIDFLHFMSLQQIEETMDQMQPSLFNVLDLCEEETLVRMCDSLSRRQNYLFFRGCGPRRTYQGWSDVFHVKSVQHNQNGHAGFEATTWATVTGFDYLWEETCLGGAFGYARDDLTWKKRRGSGGVNSYYGMLYGNWISRYVYGQLSLIGTANDESASRRVEFVGTEFDATVRHAKHSQWGSGVLSNAEFGFLLGDVERKAEVRPFGRADYVFLHRWGFQEEGAQSIDLNVEAHDADLLRMETGFRFSKCFSFRTSRLQRVNRISPYLQIAAVWEKRYQGTTSRGSFVDSNCVMTVSGLNPDRTLIDLSAGLGARCWDDHLLLSLDFEKEWGRYYRDTTWSLRAKLEF